MPVCLLLAVLTAGPITETQVREYYEAELAKPVEERAHPRFNPASLNVEEIAILPYAFDPRTPQPFLETEIAEIVSDREMVLLVTPYRIVRRSTIGFGEPVAGKTYRVFISGVDTRGQVDGKAVKIGGGFKVNRTVKHGGATMFELVPFDLPKLK